MELSPEKIPAAGPVAASPWGGVRGRAPEAGFTLVELLAVIVIIGAVLVMVLPRFSDISFNRLKSDASRLSTLIRYLNEASETKRMYFKVLFDMDRGVVSVRESADGSEYSPMADPRLAGMRLAEGVRIEDVVTPGLGRLGSGALTVVFTPAGTTEPFTLHIAAEGGKDAAFTLEFNPYSGRVTVTEGYT